MKSSLLITAIAVIVVAIMLWTRGDDINSIIFTVICLTGIFLFKILAPKIVLIIVLLMLIAIATGLALSQVTEVITDNPIYLLYGAFIAFVANLLGLGALYSFTKSTEQTKVSSTSFFTKLPIQLVCIAIFFSLESMIFANDVKILIEEQKFKLDSLGLIMFFSVIFLLFVIRIHGKQLLKMRP